MAQSCPGTPMLGGRMQKALTHGGPSVPAGHHKWHVQGSGLGLEPLSIFFNDLEDEVKCSKSWLLPD